MLNLEDSIESFTEDFKELGFVARSLKCAQNSGTHIHPTLQSYTQRKVVLGYNRRTDGAYENGFFVDSA
jgi:hypothetical protein